jgi:hypothetical protein
MRQYIYSFLVIFISTLTTFGDVIVLTSGEQLEGTVESQNDKVLYVEHALLGNISIELKDITSLNGKSLIGPPIATSIEEQTTLPVVSRWNQSLNVGFSVQNGEKKTSDLFTAYHADKTADEHKVTIDMSYKILKSNGERTLNRFAGSWGNVWYRSDSMWDIFTTLQFDWAEFQSWDQRLVGNVGIAYELIKEQKDNESFTLSIRLGSGFKKEFQSENEDWIPEGLLGATTTWIINEKQSLTADTTWYPDYDDSTNYRLVTNASWNIEMINIKNLQFSIGLHHEYDSDVNPGVNSNYLHISAGIKYLF